MKLDLLFVCEKRTKLLAFIYFLARKMHVHLVRVTFFEQKKARKRTWVLNEFENKSPLFTSEMLVKGCIDALFR